MNIIIAKHSGFCFGVKRAIDIAKSTLQSKSAPIYIVGEIVHNKFVVNDLRKSGLISVANISSIPANSTIILKAHGSPPETYSEAKSRNLNIVDATCPMVNDIHNQARKLEKDGYQVVVFGDKKHEEVISICGYINNAIVVRKKEDILNSSFKSRVAMVCQSTQKIDEISTAVAELSKKVEELLFVNTTCQTTRLRQKEVKELALIADKVIVVGSRNSANTKHLYQETKALNSSSFWIENAEDIANIDFHNEDTVAIVSGASTPESIIKNIARTLRK